jgi:hypothetical protein
MIITRKVLDRRTFLRSIGGARRGIRRPEARIPD